jgi:dTDP-4-amino-4,6-dideoxygalactose transaminase/acetyltransferase-like isoleucine patch superfamily enzyme
MNNTAIIICGGGSYGALVLDALRSKTAEQSYFVWDERENREFHPAFVDVVKLNLSGGVMPSILDQFSSIEFYVAEGKGSSRYEFATAVRRGFGQDARTSFPTFVHHTAVVSPGAAIQPGCFIGPHSVVHTHASVGEFVFMTNNVIIEQDCTICDFVTMHSSSVLLEGAKISAFTIIGANALVKEQCSIAAPHTVVDSGAVVVENIDRSGGNLTARPDEPAAVDENEMDQESSIRWCYKKPFDLERFAHYLQPSIVAGHLTNDGPLQAVLTEKVQSLVKSKSRALLACSGTAALHALCTGWSLKRGRKLKWVTQAFTFPSSFDGPLHDSFVADIDPVWRGPCQKILEQHKEEFDGVIITNAFGFQTEILEYERWCQRNDKLLISDNAATPIGFVDDEQKTCLHDIGDGSIISFHETKPFGRGEGGAILAKREVLSFVHQAMNFGYDIPRQIRVPERSCSNWRMSDIAAAAICDHLDIVLEDQWVRKLNELAIFAEGELERNGLAFAFPIRYPTVLSCVFVKHLHGTMPANIVLNALHSRNIEAKQYYRPICDRSDAPVAWEVYDSTICLPFHVGISKCELALAIKLTGRICRETISD